MTKKITYIAGTFLCMLACSLYVQEAQAATVISGKPDTLGQPFPFTVLPHAYDPITSVVYVGANEDISGLSDADKSQAVSAAGSGNSAVFAITPQKIKVNNIADQDNPLFGQKIKFLAMAEKDPLVVTDANPNVLATIIDARSNLRSVVTTGPLTDATGSALSDGIVGVTGFTRLDSDGDLVATGFAAAVRPNMGLFGATGSAILQGKIQRTIIGEGEAAKLEYSMPVQKTFPVDTTTDSLKITSDLAMIDPTAVAMHGSTRLVAFYTGLQVTGGAGATDGARSVLLNGNLAVVPAAAIEADSIIGGQGSNVQVSAHFLATMWTSTSTDYLIVVGGVGDPSTNKSTVYALPVVGLQVVTSENVPVNAVGILAKKNSLPISIPKPRSQNRTFDTRGFVVPATAPGDLFSPTDDDIYRARVGGTADLPGDIVDLIVEKDTVFVAIGSQSATEKGGVFYSQALFDVSGRIMGWTDWRRTVGSTENIFGIALDAKFGRFWFMPGADSASVNLLKRNDWGPGGGFEAALQNLFADESAGMQGLFDFDKNTSAFSQVAGERISVVCATGYNKVVLAQSGSDEGVQFCDAGGLTTPFTSTNGSLAGFVAGVDSITISGGELAAIGPIIAADFLSDGVNSWLVVGGSHGCAILANNDGTGWAAGTLAKGFVNVPATASFKKIGNYSQVRKIIADNNKLYVLTETELVRIDASADMFSGGIGNIGTQLAAVGTLAESVINPSSDLAALSSFSDFAVSGKFALLATNAGLLRVGNTKDASLAENPNQMGWTFVNLPESSGSVTRIAVASPTGKQTEFTTDQRGGNIYVLSAAVSNHSAKIYRFAVNGLIDGAEISNNTFMLFDDFFVVDKSTFYVSRGQYRNYFVTDGAMLFMSRSAYYPTNRKAFLEILDPVQRVGSRFGPRNAITVYEVNDGFRVGEMIHRSASGSWLIPGSTLGVGA